MANVMVRFYVDDQRDTDLVTWLERQAGGRRSEMIRRALRARLKTDPDPAASGVDTETLRQLLREELARVAIGVAAQDAAHLPGEDDELGERSTVF